MGRPLGNGKSDVKKEKESKCVFISEVLLPILLLRLRLLAVLA